MTQHYGYTEVRQYAEPSFDGDTHNLVARAERFGIPVGIARGGDIHVIRSLDQLDQLTPKEK